jgi:hypothetical protein
VTEENIGRPVGLFTCMRHDTFWPAGFDTGIGRYQSELEFWQGVFEQEIRYPRKICGVMRQPRQVCCLCVCVSVCARAYHKAFSFLWRNSPKSGLGRLLFFEGFLITLRYTTCVRTPVDE